MVQCPWTDGPVEPVAPLAGYGWGNPAKGGTGPRGLYQAAIMSLENVSESRRATRIVAASLGMPPSAGTGATIRQMPYGIPWPHFRALKWAATAAFLGSRMSALHENAELLHDG